MEMHCKENGALQGQLGFVLMTAFSYWGLIIYNSYICQNVTELKLSAT